MAQTGLSEIEIALETLPESDPLAAYPTEQLPKARALLKRLKER